MGESDDLEARNRALADCGRVTFFNESEIKNNYRDGETTKQH